MNFRVTQQTNKNRTKQNKKPDSSRPTTRSRELKIKPKYSRDFHCMRQQGSANILKNHTYTSDSFEMYLNVQGI